MKHTKKISLIILMLITFSKTFAQAYDEALQSKLVASYNHKDYKAFYSLGSDDWQNKHKLDGITGWLSWMYGQTGQVTGFSYVRQKGDYQLIRWEGEHKVIAFTLKPGSQGQYNDFGFDPFKEPPLRR